MQCLVQSKGRLYVNIHVLRRLKEDLAWAIDKRLQVISNIKQL